MFSTDWEKDMIGGVIEWVREDRSRSSDRGRVLSESFMSAGILQKQDPANSDTSSAIPPGTLSIQN